MQMHQDEGAQHGFVTGSGAYREYPQGMVSFSIILGEMSHYAIGTYEWTTVGSTEETTS